MIDRDEGRYWETVRHENPNESLLRLQSLEALRIYAFAGAGSDYDIFKPHLPGTNTIYQYPLLYTTPSVRLALFFALAVNNPAVKNDPERKTITCEHPVSPTEPELNIYIGADQETIDIVDVPENFGWVGVFLPGQFRAVRDYSEEGRAGESASVEPQVPFELIKVANRHFPFPIREIPIYTPPSGWTIQQRRKHTPYVSEGFPCFQKKHQPFDRVYPVLRKSL